MANYGITVDSGGRGWSRAEPLPFMNDTEAMKAALASMRSGVRALGADIQGASRRLERMGRACGGVLAALMDARSVVDGLRAGMRSLYAYSRTWWKTFAGTLSALAGNAAYLKNSLAAMGAPLLNALAPAIEGLTDRFVGLFNLVNQFFARLGGASTYVAAKRTAAGIGAVGGAASGATAQVKALERQLADFDDLNVLSGTENGGNGSGGGGSGGGAGVQFEERQIESGLAAFADSLRAAFEASDWMTLGTLIGEKINALLDSVDWAALGRKVGFYVNGLFSTAYWTLETVNFTNIGASVAQFLNNALAEIDFTTVGATVALLFTSLAETMAGFAEEFDWVQFAEKLADGLNGFVGKLGEKLDAVDWGALALKLTEGLNAFIARTDWAKAGKTLAGRVNDLLEILGAASASFDWSGAGEALATAVNNLFKSVDWEGLGDWLNDTLQGVLDFGIAFLQGFDAAGFAENVGRALAKVDWGAVAEKLWTLLKAALVKLGEFFGALLFGGSADLKLNLALLKDGWTSISDFVGTVVEVIAKLSPTPAEGSSTLPGVFGSVFDVLSKLTGKEKGSQGLLGVYGSYFEVLSKLTGKTDKSKTLAEVYGESFNTQSDLTGKVKDTQGLLGVYGTYFETKAALTDKTKGSKDLVPDGERKGVFASFFGVEANLTGKTGDSKDLKASSKRKGVFASFFTVLSKLTGKEKGSDGLNDVYGKTFTVTATLSSTINGLSDFVRTVADKLRDALENIWKKITSSGAATGGVITNGGRLRPFARGGVIRGGMASYLNNVPHYAGGTSRAHGTVFVAGEAGPEIMGHINGRTEILNKSQLAQTMYSAVVAGMGQAVSALGTFLSAQMANCTNAIVGSIGGLAAANIRYHEPVMATGTVLPYDVAAQIAKTGADIRGTLDANNEDLIQTIVSVAGQIVAAVQAQGNSPKGLALLREQGTGNRISGGLTAQQMIDDINRRAQMFGSSPILD